MIWPIILSTALGLLCGLWLPLLPFIVIALIGSFGVTLSSFIAGYTLPSAAFMGVYVAFIIQTSYVFGILARGLITKLFHRHTVKVLSNEAPKVNL